jgi:aldehyde:ferredoxin oxidoreductase
VADSLLEEERWRQVLTSLVICLFARNIYTPEMTQKALASTGFNLSLEELSAIGADTLHRKYDFKMKEGFDLSQIRIPRRIYETTSPLGNIDETFMREAIKEYASKV